MTMCHFCGCNPCSWEEFGGEVIYHILPLFSDERPVTVELLESVRHQSFLHFLRVRYCNDWSLHYSDTFPCVMEVIEDDIIHPLLHS